MLIRPAAKASSTAAGGLSTSLNELTSTVSSFIRTLQCDDLWVMLYDCLDIVRDLEGLDGLADAAHDEDDIEGDTGDLFTDTRPSSSSSAAAVSPGKNKLVSPRRASRPSVDSRSSGAEAPENHLIKKHEPKALSVLTMRFMPLIECYLSVCNATVLEHPLIRYKKQKAATAPTTTKQPITTTTPPSDTTITSTTQEAAASTAPEPILDHERTIVETLQHRKMNVIGMKFRKHITYWDMQMELLDDTPTTSTTTTTSSTTTTTCSTTTTTSSSRRLLQFVRRNHLLLNIILRNSIHLLEGSFAVLITVPKLRHFLHFDIKRAYFRLKLKQIRQSASTRSSTSSSGGGGGGSLRLSVRRANVFEDSFNQLRHKTADEMRRRLTVNFQG